MGGILKSAAKVLLDACQANEILVRSQRSDLLALCYHGVVSEARPDRWSYENWASASEFRSQLRWLKSVLEPIDLAGLARWHRGEWKGRKGPVLITFDDGYRNNLTVAAPILREEGVPAVFFLATGFIGKPGLLWNDEVRMRVLHWPAPEIRLPSGETVPVSPGLRARRDLADKANRECKRLTEEPWAGYLDYLRSENPALNVMDDVEAREFMSWDDARALADAGFDLGSHTVDHPILSMMSRERMARELRDSKAIMERELGRPCTSIAYPNGAARDVNDTLFEEVGNAGYQWAFTMMPRWQKRGDDPHRLPRLYFPGQADLTTFKLYASGLHTRLAGSD